MERIYPIGRSQNYREKILYGIGCLFMKSPENHYKKYKYFKHLRRFSLVLSIFSLPIFVIGIIFHI